MASNVRIFKYALEVTDAQDIEMPSGAEVLCVQVQHGSVCLWAKVNDDNDPTEKRIYIYGTGHSMSENAGRYVGTFQLHGGDLVFHVFEGRAR